jgi:type 1 glutamine amidotransferase
MTMRVSTLVLILVGFVGLSALGGCDTDSSKVGDQQPGTTVDRILFLVSEDPNNYEAHKTIPVFADTLQKLYGFQTKVIQGEGEPNAFRFPGLEALRESDLLVIFFRRRALSTDQLAMIRAHLEDGKPLIGIRTANHAFSVRGDIPDGYEPWWEFVPEVLGCENRGYGREADGMNVSVAPEMADHPILKGVEPKEWRAEGSLYLVKPLIDTAATVLLTGSAADKTEPIAWTRTCGTSRVFYTSLGYPTNFEQAPFRRLLVNAIHWVLERPVPSAGEGTRK